MYWKWQKLFTDDTTLFVGNDYLNTVAVNLETDKKPLFLLIIQCCPSSDSYQHLGIMTYHGIITLMFERVYKHIDILCRLAH